MALKELTSADIREISDMAATIEAIDSPQEFTAAHFGSPAFAEWQAASDTLTRRIDALSEVARTELTALAWLGRGHSGDNFDDLVTQANSSGSEGRSRYLAGKASLRIYLENGAHKLGVAI